MLLNIGSLRSIIRSTTNKNLINQTFKLLSTSANESTNTEAKPQGSEVPKQDAKLENELKLLQEKSAKQEAELNDCKDKLLRALAEAENTRNRMRKEVENAKIFGIQGFCKDLLEVADVLNLAIENTNPNKTQNSNDQPKTDPRDQLNSMYKGLVMTETCLLKIFEKNGLVQIKPQPGEPFDPNTHEAIFRIPIPDKKSGSVEVVTKIGFKLHTRVIRAAQVGVVQ